MPMSASTIPTAMQYTTAAPETMTSSSSSNQSSVDTKCVVSSSSVKKMVCGFSVLLIRVVLIDWSGSEDSNLLSFYNNTNEHSMTKSFSSGPLPGFSPWLPSVPLHGRTLVNFNLNLLHEKLLGDLSVTFALAGYFPLSHQSTAYSLPCAMYSAARCWLPSVGDT